MIKVLLIEDDKVIAQVIQYYLQQESLDYKVFWVKTAGEAMAFVVEPFDVILLDILLPDVNGIDFCQKLREWHPCPIIFISCLDDTQTIVQALAMGGDDFIVKPFDNKILGARIQANLRRVALDEKRTATAHTPLVAGRFRLDFSAQSLCIDDRTVNLSSIEFRLLSFLMQNPNQYFTAQELYRRIWGKDSYGDIRTVQVHIHSLRKKLESSPSDPHYIKNIHGKGYCFAIADA